MKTKAIFATIISIIKMLCGTIVYIIATTLIGGVVAKLFVDTKNAVMVNPECYFLIGFICEFILFMICWMVYDEYSEHMKDLKRKMDAKA